jgi:hypothetical protein
MRSMRLRRLLEAQAPRAERAWIQPTKEWDDLPCPRDDSAVESWLEVSFYNRGVGERRARRCQ